MRYYKKGDCINFAAFKKMKISYTKVLNKNQLILSDFNSSSFSSNYIVKMITNNTIPGLLPTEIQFINNIPSFYYNTTSKHSLSSFLEDSKVEYELITKLIIQINSLQESLHNYMLDNDYILLSPELVFLNPETLIPSFCYCPIIEENISYNLIASLRSLLEFIITKLDYSDKECVALTYTLYQKSQDNSTTISQLTNYIHENDKHNYISKSKEEPSCIPKEHLEEHIQTDPEESPVSLNIKPINNLPPSYVLKFTCIFIVVAIALVLELYFYFINNSISFNLFIILFLSSIAIFLSSLPYFISQKKHHHFYNSINTDEEVTNSNEEAIAENKIMDIGDTVLINHCSPKKEPFLIYNGNALFEDIHLFCFPFTIGKMPDSTNFIINNSLISRIHARFYFKENTYYIEDMNSSNGTYINDVSISPYTMTEINNSDIITFANVSFIFKETLR